MSHGRSRLIERERFAEIYRAWRDEIREAIDREAKWALVGIKRRGARLARRLWNDLRGDGLILEYGELDISLYRDDYHLQARNPRVLGTEIAFPVEGTPILLVDDVLYTGRTVRAALDLILDFGRPRCVWLAVFVDRGHRELPIAADFTGTRVETARDDRVLVLLEEMGEAEDAVDLIPQAAVKGGKDGG